MSESPKAELRTTQLRRNERKWTRPLMDAGWTAVPSILLECQSKLGLNSLDLNILLQLAKHWWEAENPPFPSKRTIAREIGCHPRTVQRRIEELEKAGLIQREARRSRHGGSKTNLYRFDGLIAKATPYANEKVAEIRSRQAAKRKRRPRGLRVMKGGKK